MDTAGRVLPPPGKSLRVLDFLFNFYPLESLGNSLWSWKVLEITLHGPGSAGIVIRWDAFS